MCLSLSSLHLCPLVFAALCPCSSCVVQLSYFAAATDRSAKETFDLRECTLVSDTPRPNGGSASKDEGAEFEWVIHVSKKKLQLRATTADDKKCWLALLMPFHNAQPSLASRAWLCLPISPQLATGVRVCVEALGHSGCVQGIFRESGRAESVQALYIGFLRGEQQLPDEADVHAVAGCLKKLLREMPETLFTNTLYADVVAPNPSPAKVRGNRAKAIALFDVILCSLMSSLPSVFLAFPAVVAGSFPSPCESRVVDIVNRAALLDRMSRFFNENGREEFSSSAHTEPHT